MVDQDSPLEDLTDAIRGDESESADLPCEYKFGGLVPPVHDVISLFRDVRIGLPESLDVAVPECLPDSPAPNEGRISYYEIRCWPLRLTRVHVPINPHLSTIIWDVLPCHWALLVCNPIPSRHRYTFLINQEFLPVARQHGVPIFDVPVVPQHRLRDRLGAAASANLPLDVADPEDKFGDLFGPALDLDTSELFGRNGCALDLQKILLLPQVAEETEDLALQSLEEVEADIQEVARPTCWIQYSRLGESAMESADGFLRVIDLAALHQPADFGPNEIPIRSQGLLDGGSDEPLDVSPGCVVSAEAMALPRVQSPLQEGAEDGGLDIRPIAMRRLLEPLELGTGERQGLLIGEEPAVEAEELAEKAEGRAVVHRLPEGRDAGGEGWRVGDPVLIQSVSEEVIGEKTHVLCKEGEDAPHEESGDPLRVLAGFFELPRQLGQMGGDLASDTSGVLRRVEAVGVQEDGAEAIRILLEVREVDTRGLAVRERTVVPRLVESGVEVEAVADVAGHQERGRIGKGAGIAEGLAVGVAHRDVPGRGAAARGAELLAPFLGSLLGFE
ncbi:MAG: hypothetical protein QOF89_5420 [Acidobacteriota bacterium]|jgi:hypothetical protein|nr:hypothetical protein [Acidobacteriota bacterium]